LSTRSQDPRCFVGSVSAQGEWLILVKLPRKAWDDATRMFVRQQWMALTEMLKQAGFSDSAQLDMPTRLFLKESGIFSSPPYHLLDTIIS
jgi:hypothetical protein